MYTTSVILVSTSSVVSGGVRLFSSFPQFLMSLLHYAERTTTSSFLTVHNSANHRTKGVSRVVLHVAVYLLVTWMF